MKFNLVDDILTQTDDSILAVKQVSLAEEYLQDHFPSFPILPGVMMIEAMVQAARKLLSERSSDRLVLGEIKALKYGAMVRPGDALEIRIDLKKANDDGTFTCKGTGIVRRTVLSSADTGDSSPDSEITTAQRETAVSGRFTMRPVRI